MSTFKPTKISATSRCAIKVRDNYYTVEATEERTLTDIEAEVNMEEEWKSLWDEVNDIVDGQCEEIIQTFKK